MSYTPVRYPVNGLGYTMTISTPVGDQSISIPIEQAMNDIANMAVNAVWPIAMEKLKAEVPGLVGQVWAAAKPYLDAEEKKIVQQANQMVNKVQTKVDTTVTKTTNLAGLFIGILIVGGAGVVMFSKIKSKKQSQLAKV